MVFFECHTILGFSFKSKALKWCLDGTFQLKQLGDLPLCPIEVFFHRNVSICSIIFSGIVTFLQRNVLLFLHG